MSINIVFFISDVENRLPEVGRYQVSLKVFQALAQGLKVHQMTINIFLRPSTPLKQGRQVAQITQAFLTP